MQPLPRPNDVSPAALRELAAELENRISGEVRFDLGSRALYATDGSNYRQVPLGVVIPRSAEEVVETIALCRSHGAPVTLRGGGTALAGQTTNWAVIVDCSKYLNKIIDINPHTRLARVQPGVVLDHLREAAEAYHLTFGPDPATHDHNCLGGMIGNNSCGIHSVMAGRTADNVQSLDIVTYDGLRLKVGPTSESELAAIIRQGGRRGEIYARLKTIRDSYGDLIRQRFPTIPRRVSGFNLDQLLPENGFNVARALVGTEGTCVTVLEAELNLIASPPVRRLVVLGYRDVYQAGDHVPEILEFGPVGLEGVDCLLTDFMGKKHLHEENLVFLPQGKGWLLVEFGGDDAAQAEAKARDMMDALSRRPDAPSMCLYTKASEMTAVWQIREAGLGATANVPGQPLTWPGWEDAAVEPAKVGAYLRDFRALLDEFSYRCSLYGHFGDGCIHVRIDFDLMSAEGIAKYRRFVERAADLVLRYGGSFSGEHGDGQSRGELLPKMFGPELVEAFRQFKHIWDPANRMNPGKVVDAFPLDTNLRLGIDYQPPAMETAFSYGADHGSFPQATLRCVGVGKCRHHKGGVMCPSYMATGEEKHSTRGRARLLFEMVGGQMPRGGPVQDGWRDKAVFEALDLCLACKGCKRDCPVNVDMATYKAEFYHHYYKGKLRPRSDYAMGLIYWWSRAAAQAPGLANALLQTRPFAAMAKKMAGIAPQRRFPRFAEETFRTQIKRRPMINGGQKRVVLFPDTFNTYFHPETAMAAIDVLQEAGYQVVVPARPLCCGRPLYPIGMIDQARRQLKTIMEVLGPEAADGTPIIGLEPACVTTFKDELLDLFPDDPRARVLAKQTHMLGDFLVQQNWQPPRLKNARAIVHAHCHQHAVLGIGPDLKMLEKAGIAYDKLDSGCCGMAGSFGFEADKYDVSMACGERVLLPQARRAKAAGKLVIANGYSCREQLAQGAGCESLHLADVLKMAIQDGQL